MMSGAAKASEYTQVHSDTDTNSGLGISMGGEYMKSKLLIMDIKKVELGLLQQIYTGSVPDKSAHTTTVLKGDLKYGNPLCKVDTCCAWP